MFQQTHGLVYIFATMVTFTFGMLSETTIPELQQKVIDSEARLAELKATLKSLSRQMVLLQHQAMDNVQNSGHSGISNIRQLGGGSMPYLTHHFTGFSFASIHDHSNNIRTIGMGEVVAVMNGVEFRTRHNDYRLYKPHSTSSELHAFEEIDFPPVPEDVLNKETVPEQIEEMKEWFKAWKNSDHSVRDYRNYFKPVLCYMEGAWTVFNELVDESFVSDRHKIDAETWYELEELVRFLSYTGGKHTKEDLAYLPKILINVTEDGELVFAQWNYRIMCHPLSIDVPLNRFRVVPDLKSQLINLETEEESVYSKTARFTLNSRDRDKFLDGKGPNEYLETMMREIPGKDNYQGDLRDNNLEGVAVDPKTNEELNVAYYHKVYSVSKKDASGIQTRYRGFSDPNMWMAMTSQEGILGMENIRCVNLSPGCGDKLQNWSYAFPLEIIYLTPLQTWNPYNIVYKGEHNSIEGKTVKGPDADGSYEKPLKGSNSKLYFRTPFEFFEDSGDEDRDPADTTPPGAVYAEDSNGVTRALTASGIRILLPYIEGVGMTRTRWPIAPVHEEGSAIYKEFDALKQILLYPSTYSFLYKEPFGGSGERPARPVVFETGTSRVDGVEAHTHTITISEDDYNQLKNGLTLTVDTSVNNGHHHSMTLKMFPEDPCVSKILFDTCDGNKFCFDRHRKCLSTIRNPFQ